LEESSSNPSWYVFKENHGGSNLIDDSEGVRDRPVAVTPTSLIVVANSFAGNAVRLAGQSSNDAIHFSAPRFAVKRGKVSPDRRDIQASRFHERNQLATGECFPLDVAHRAKVASDSESGIKHSDAGTE
jgi:hypothetical protein